MKRNGKLSRRTWLSIVLFGLAGQVAWTIENMYLNLFMYQTITTDPFWIALMVSTSAVVATLTTMVMGAWSDRIGKRRIFLCLGYFFWGISVLLFSLGSTTVVETLFPQAVQIAERTAVLLIVLDLIMTFFGSTANDAVFNAFVSEVPARENRGRVEGLLSAFPLLAMLFVFALLDPLAQTGRWSLFFTIVGTVTALLGLLGFFLLPPDRTPASQSGVWENLCHAFSGEAWRQHRSYYLALGLLFVISVSMQVYMPYIIIYIQEYLGFDSYALLLGTVLSAAATVSIWAGRLIDRKGFLRPFPFFFMTALLGLVAMFFARTMLPVGIAVFLMLASYLVLTSIATAMLREYTPAGMAGRYQGMRMIFAVMLPMVAGPFIGSALFSGSAAVYQELGSEKKVPTPGIFLGAALILLLTLVFFSVLKREDAREAAPVEKER